MREIFRHVKLALGAILVILVVSLAVLGGYRVYKDHFILDYDPHLTQKEYQNTVLDQNVNLVFYKKDCPYCQVEKAATIIKIRKGKIKKYLYASRDSEEKIVADEKSIQEAIND